MGIYSLNRLSFGVKVAPSILQQLMDTMQAGLDFAVAYLDYVLRRRKKQTRRQHSEHIQVFQISEEGFQFFKSNIKHLSGDKTD